MAINYADNFDIKPPRRPGLKKGQTHSGSFRPGPDPRRIGYSPLLECGKTLPQLARERTQEAFELICGVMNDEEQDIKLRVQAAESVLNRGWGKAPMAVQVTHNETDNDPSRWPMARLASAAAEILQDMNALPAVSDDVDDNQEAVEAVFTEVSENE